MAITEKDVLGVAELARLSLTNDEAKTYASQLKSILEYANKLSEVNTDGVEPTVYPLPPKSVTRPDLIIPSLSQADALRNAPKSDRGCFKVPKIIE
ncbi:MAG: Asp-tRNA(Asn)/Glu-tRNA(Gln) amidotransferase subunit GatC [Deltaproteobacteria bacterium]|nr:Asp-tRNA(Asn)/Glu-tRNA(Gln) amidotransferase subunit GatC [Deltaproteobacteria bacterium]